MAPVKWPDDIDAVLAGDLTAALAYATPAKGAVLAPVAPVGLRDRAAGTVGFTTSLGFGRKLERIKAHPQVALAYHAREHGFATGTELVVVQGTASFDPEPDAELMESMVAQRAARFMGPAQRGRLWDPWLHEYYADRLVVDVAVRRIVAWPDLLAAGEPRVFGEPLPDPPPSQRPPGQGTGPRVDVDTVARRVARLPHRLLGYVQADGFPAVVPVALGARGPEGVELSAAPGLLPPGARRAGLTAHTYRAKLIGLEARQHTGWLEVAQDGRAVYAPHTAAGFQAPPNKTLLLIANGGMAKVGMWRARRQRRVEALKD